MPFVLHILWTEYSVLLCPPVELINFTNIAPQFRPHVDALLFSFFHRFCMVVFTGVEIDMKWRASKRNQLFRLILPSLTCTNTHTHVQTDRRREREWVLFETRLSEDGALGSHSAVSLVRRGTALKERRADVTRHNSPAALQTLSRPSPTCPKTPRRNCLPAYPPQDSSPTPRIIASILFLSLFCMKNPNIARWNSIDKFNFSLHIIRFEVRKKYLGCISFRNMQITTVNVPISRHNFIAERFWVGYGNNSEKYSRICRNIFL